jgi:hypothetical protein
MISLSIKSRGDDRWDAITTFEEMLIYLGWMGTHSKRSKNFNYMSADRQAICLTALPEP